MRTWEVVQTSSRRIARLAMTAQDSTTSQAGYDQELLVSKRLVRDSTVFRSKLPEILEETAGEHGTWVVVVFRPGRGHAVNDRSQRDIERRLGPAGTHTYSSRMTARRAQKQQMGGMRSAEGLLQLERSVPLITTWNADGGGQRCPQHPTTGWKLPRACFDQRF
jgi:hypothetical protein